jgi:hypothetical protein
MEGMKGGHDAFMMGSPLSTESQIPGSSACPTRALQHVGNRGPYLCWIIRIAENRGKNSTERPDKQRGL